MRMQSPSLVVSSSRSLLTNTIKLSNKPVRLLALLALIAVAATALAATSSSAQVLFGKASAMLGLGSTPASSAMKAAPANPTLMSPNSPLPPSDTMLVERRGHTATRLSNGTVLIAGGENSSGALNECEILRSEFGNFLGNREHGRGARRSLGNLVGRWTRIDRRRTRCGGSVDYNRDFRPDDREHSHPVRQ